jgi:2-dehydro-3-deoxygalactonokinase
MTRPAALIIGDWGNSNARAWLCAADGTVLDERRGPGIASLRSDPAAIAAAFAAMTSGWPDTVPALLAGVVGASFGWRDAGYMPCPIPVDQIGSHVMRAPTNIRDIWIAPGISCINAWGQPDTMRGEELQIVGWAAQNPGRDALVALPGTHCKWALVVDGQVTRFHSAISGELFAMLRDHSVMVDHSAQAAPYYPAAFAEGVELAKGAARVDLSALLFTARARQATGDMAAEVAPSFVSGIVIGCDVRTAFGLYGRVHDIVVIGGDAVAACYEEALNQWGNAATRVDGDAMMRAGLLAVNQQNLVGTRGFEPPTPTPPV